MAQAEKNGRTRKAAGTNTNGRTCDGTGRSTDTRTCNGTGTDADGKTGITNDGTEKTTDKKSAD